MTMPGPKTYQFDTLSLHAGQQPDPQFGARAQPIYFTTSFVFPDAEHAASLFNMERAGHVYSRSKSVSPRWKAASARSAPPAARRRCTSRSPH
jgi:O-acetylhomoserine/O-acetylserine sulfhydrylase-like pyridoxal-dependent enzyme